MTSPLVLLHGFTQSGDVWRDLGIEHACPDRQIVQLDLPGHGESPESVDGSDLWKAAELARIPTPAAYIGYSLGARVALHAALQQPAGFEALVLVGARAGYVDRAEATARREADNALADWLLQDPAAFIDEWLASPVNNRLTPEQHQRDLRLANRAEGLAASLRHCGYGTQEDLRPRLGVLEMPVLLVVGEYDLPGMANEAHEMAALIGSNASVKVVNGAGHSSPFERPDDFGQILQNYLADIYHSE